MLQLYLDFWQLLIIENELVKRCNELAVSTRIVVFAALCDEVFRALHKNAHQGYEELLRRITQILVASGSYRRIVCESVRGV